MHVKIILIIHWKLYFINTNDKNLELNVHILFVMHNCYRYI